MRTRLALAAALATLIPGLDASADGAVDARLVAEIAKIKAIDDHAHPLKIVRPGEPADTDYDALSLVVMEPFPFPVRLRLDNPEWIGAWRALYGYPFADMTEAHVATVTAARDKAMAAHGDGYPAWVLDQLGIERMLANRVAPGRGLVPPRFAWVSFVDALMLPLRFDPTHGANPDVTSFYLNEAKLLDRYLSEATRRCARPASSSCTGAGAARFYREAAGGP